MPKARQRYDRPSDTHSPTIGEALPPERRAAVVAAVRCRTCKAERGSSCHHRNRPGSIPPHTLRVMDALRSPEYVW